MSFAPIALFAYKRPAHLERVVEALARNPEATESELFVFADAAKSAADEIAVAQVRGYLRGITGFAATRIIERAENFGLARSIIEGVTQVCRERGRVIVLEDDIVTSPFFLKYMNEALALYESDERVISVHGYVYPVDGLPPETFFLRGADCWGWATWQRGWALFDPDGRRLLRQLREKALCAAFDLDGAFPYSAMLKAQISARNDSWAIRWHASAFLQDKLTLYPGGSLVLNIGTDSSGTHCGATDRFSGKLSDSPISVQRQPVEEDRMSRGLIRAFLKQVRPSLPRRLAGKLAGFITGGR